MAILWWAIDLVQYAGTASGRAVAHRSTVGCYSEPPEVVTEKCLDAKKMLDTWKSSYFSTRAKIEESGRDSRWEFDRKRLFERTDYMAKICEDLAEVAKVCTIWKDIYTQMEI